MRSLLIVFLVVPFICLSQAVNGYNYAGQICNKLKGQTPSEFDNSIINKELDRILNSVGLAKNFVVHPCDRINNALALSLGGERYIFYDPDFIQELSVNSSDWTSIFILAHEVGHHINGHTIDLFLDLDDKKDLALERQEELEADTFAGFVMSSLGADLGQILLIIDQISDNKNDLKSTHPNKDKRIEAIKKGFQKSTNTNLNQEVNEAPSMKFKSIWVLIPIAILLLFILFRGSSKKRTKYILITGILIVGVYLLVIHFSTLININLKKGDSSFSSRALHENHLVKYNLSGPVRSLNEANFKPLFKNGKYEADYSSPIEPEVGLMSASLGISQNTIFNSLGNISEALTVNPEQDRIKIDRWLYNYQEARLISIKNIILFRDDGLWHERDVFDYFDHDHLNRPQRMIDSGAQITSLFNYDDENQLLKIQRINNFNGEIFYTTKRYKNNYLMLEEYSYNSQVQYFYDESNHLIKEKHEDLKFDSFDKTYKFQVQKIDQYGNWTERVTFNEKDIPIIFTVRKIYYSN